MTASYAGIADPQSLGKGVGPALAQRAQVEEAADAGLGFVVLKTVIAQDAAGQQSMSAWAIKESQMVVEPIASPIDRRDGLDGHLEGPGLVAVVRRLPRTGARALRDRPPTRDARRPVGEVPPPRARRRGLAGGGVSRDDARRSSTPIDPADGERPMPLEKDFSPTLAGSDRAGQRAIVLEWLRRVPDSDPPAGRDGPGQGRTQALQQPRRRRFPARDARRGARRSRAPISSSTPIGFSIPIACSRASAASPTAAPT